MLFLGIEICKLFVRRLQKIFAQNRKIFVVRFSGLSKLVTYKKFPAQNGKIFVLPLSGLFRLGIYIIRAGNLRERFPAVAGIFILHLQIFHLEQF